jgi:hypothetical protein
MVMGCPFWSPGVVLRRAEIEGRAIWTPVSPSGLNGLATSWIPAPVDQWGPALRAEVVPIGVEEELSAALGTEKDLEHGRLLSGVEQRKEKEKQRRLDYIPAGWKVNLKS